MATPSERKALLFFGLVAMLGAGARLWNSRRPAALAPAADTLQDSVPGSGSFRKSRSVKVSGTATATARSRRTASRTGQINRDSESIVDLDLATSSEIDALGVLPKGLARLIVADRDSFGPFGSMDELRRIPFISASTLRKLAPRVTFSRIPRPRNTVVNPRPTPPPARRRSTGGQP